MASFNPARKQTPVIITIDGPAGAGKSTVAKELARRLGFAYLDTGAMYRALTLKAMRQNVNLKEESQLIVLARKTSIDIGMDDKRALKVLLDGIDVTEAIRSLQVTNNTAYIAKVPGVRAVMVKRQRQIAQERNVVVEGRDIGTVVFPKATKKFYLDADFNERTQRRRDELKSKGEDVDEALLKRELKERDTKDITRPIGPLKKADDAILIDTTRMTIEEVVARIIKIIKR